MVDELECGIVVDELDESVIVCRSIVDEMIEGIGVLLNVSVQCQVNEMECGIVVDELDESVIVCRSLVDEMFEGIGVLLNVCVQCQVNEIVGCDLDCWVSMLNVDESEGPVLEEETVWVCRNIVDEIVEFADGVSEGTSDFLNVNAQLARCFEGVEYFYQPSDSEEQGWDEYVGVDIGPEQEEYLVEDGFRACVFPCPDCLIEYNTLDGLQEYLCLPNMLPPFLFRNDTPDLTTTQSPSLVSTKTRISCAVIGCDTTFARKDAMLRHVRNLHKIPKDHSCYPRN